MTEDMPFTAADLADGRLVLPDTRIVEFSIEDDSGTLVMPSRTYIESAGATEVDLAGWDVNGTWHVRAIPVYRGEDAQPGVSAAEYMVNMYLLKCDGRYLPYVGRRESFPVARVSSAPILGTSFFASGAEQLVSGTVVPVKIPAYGEYRQYVGTTEIAPGAEGVLYHFQVYRESEMIFDRTQDSLNFAASEKNHGNIFYFSPNLTARASDVESKYRYFWRVRASYKISDADGAMYWSGWSGTFPFTVNIPPGAPYNLSVSAA